MEDVNQHGNKISIHVNPGKALLDLHTTWKTHSTAWPESRANLARAAGIFSYMDVQTSLFFLDTVQGALSNADQQIRNTA